MFKKGDRVEIVSMVPGDAYIDYKLVGIKATLTQDRIAGQCVYLTVEGKSKEYGLLPSVGLKLCLAAKDVKIEFGDIVEQTASCSETIKGHTYTVGYRNDGRTLVIGKGDHFGCDCTSQWKLISKATKIGDGFVVGVTVKRVQGSNGNMLEGDEGVVTKVCPSSVRIEGYPQGGSPYRWHSKRNLKVVEKVTKEGGEEGMLKEVIADNFEKTEDAIVVEKYLGHLIQDNFISGLVVAANKDAILKEAQHLKAAAQKAEDKE